jgi:pimeloyl-ACP methyl ester carboxylesterase
MHEVETHYAKSNGGHVAYQVIGDGPRDVIFVPNWGSNVEIMWEEPSLARFLRRLATFSRLICFDKRGTGASDPVTLRALPTLEQWMEDVRSVMDAVGSERAVLIGDAEGGQMAMLFAATHPERVSALVLTNSTARHLRDDDYPCGLPARSVPPFLARMQELWGTGGLVELMAPDLAGDERFRRWYGRYERLSLSPGAIHAMYRRHLERDLRGVLPAIRVPTLVLHRAGNQHLRVGHGRYLAEHVPGSKYVELEGEDHFFHTGDTEAVLAEIGVRDRRPPGGRPRPGAGDGAVRRHRRRAAELGDRAWRALLDTHNALVRREIARFRGHEVKTAGDGFLARFDGPARAIRCAVAIRDQVRALGIDVRAGLHTGECELLDDDLGGIAVHIGARITAEARPGEVLVSSTVKDLVAGSGIRFADRGARALKGVPGEWRLFAVESPRRVKNDGPATVASAPGDVGERDDFGLRRRDGAFRQHEAPEHHAVGASFRVEPVRVPGVAVREDHAEAAVGLERRLRAVPRYRTVRVVERLEEAVP